SVSFTFYSAFQPSPSFIFSLSIHDALPILLSYSAQRCWSRRVGHPNAANDVAPRLDYPSTSPEYGSTVAGVISGPLHSRLSGWLDRKSTRLNSSHQIISYDVFCLKKRTRKR